MSNVFNTLLYGFAYCTQYAENRIMNRWRPADQVAQGVQDEAEFRDNMKRSFKAIFATKRGRV